ncbi:MAG: hypothetical protein JXA61_07480 [Bacteroidales bacterium]|nr:hypothetical protein [Bacteroidales bacterium]
MKPYLITIAFTVLVTFNTSAQNIPEGYMLQYEQNFSNSRALADFRFSNPDAWNISSSGSRYYLQYRNDTSYKPKVISPGIIGILDNYIFGDFIMEADLMPLGSDSLVSEICILLGIKDSLQYYYVQLANKINENTQGVFLVNKSHRLKITGDSTDKGIHSVFDKSTWYKIRIERDIVQRTIKVFYKDMTNPIMESRDYELVMGYIGFGAFSGSGCIDNLKIWAPTYIPEKTEIFTGTATL